MNNYQGPAESIARESAAFTCDSADEVIDAVRVILKTGLAFSVDCHTSSAPTFWTVSIFTDWADAPTSTIRG